MDWDKEVKLEKCEDMITVYENTFKNSKKKTKN